MKKNKNSEAKSATDIAIVGMSCRFPGAKNKEIFWKNLSTGVDGIEEIGKDRWGDLSWYHPDPKHEGTCHTKWAGFIENSDKFDPLFFGISPREAEIIDPQQRVFLEECWKSIEDAGYTPDDLQGEKVGVFAGVAAGDYLQLLYDSGFVKQGAAFMGNSQAILAARIAYVLNFRGPALSIDTACSSSLVAINRACNSLIAKECQVVLAGGVHLMTTPQVQIWSGKVGMLSAQGRCKTFDASADGIVVGEGVGVVVLKRLEDAEKDGDRIYAVIRGSAANQDGKTKGITVPSPQAQTEVELEVYEKFKIDPTTISYIEAHGTGTKKGDPLELKALTESFRKFTDKQQFCNIGSVKTNIGHTAYAGGVAGVIKTVLMMRHRQLVPNVHFEQANELLNIAQSPFYVNTKLSPWKTEKNVPRRAGISSFGFSGTNAHIVLEEYIEKPVPYQSNAPAIILLSAKNEVRLKEMAGNLKTFLEKNQGIDLYDLAFTLQVGRASMEERLAFTVSGISELTTQLRNYIKGRTAALLTGNITKNKTELLLKGGAGKAYIQHAVENKETASLAQLWVKGVSHLYTVMYQI